jgi:hypothetical protein
MYIFRLSAEYIEPSPLLSLLAFRVLHLIMADHTAYARYKRNQKHLVHWIVNIAAHIFKKDPSYNTENIALTGEISLATLKSLSELIVKRLRWVPETLFQLFELVIDHRKKTHNTYVQSTAINPDPEIQAINESHQHWIEGLSEAFEILGGDRWLGREAWQKEYENAYDPSAIDEAEVDFANMFAMLRLHKLLEGEGEGDTDAGSGDSSEEHQLAKGSTKRSSKGRKMNKRGRKPKEKGKTAQSTSSSHPREIPLESCRIIEDETDYSMAVMSIAELWIQLRHEMMGNWYGVAYNGMNTAVASSSCKVAIGMIKEAQSDIFFEFPERDSFDTITRKLLNGDPNKAKRRLSLSSCNIDAKEFFLIYTYHDLLDFITDYQKARSGKPTKAMLKSLGDWDPYLSLSECESDRLLEWRRSFTINWLYDLVNFFISGVQRRTMRGEIIPLDSVDWCRAGVSNEHRRLFGLNEFANEITQLAVQKPGTDIRSKILPHHVFQLQCIVDSFTVSRDWMISIQNGQIMEKAAKDFQPRRDVDLFMDREDHRKGKGFYRSVQLLSLSFDRDGKANNDPNLNKILKASLLDFCTDLGNSLGKSNYKSSNTNLQQSRFWKTNSNGLWDYCPFIWGMGLSEALARTHGMVLRMWESFPEPICILHLHNMLVKIGILSKPVALWDAVQKLHPDTFFAGGNVPTSRFAETFEKLLVFRRTRHLFDKQEQRRRFSRKEMNIHGLLDPGDNRLYKERTLLQLFHRADWNYSQISDRDIPLPTSIAFKRLVKTRRTRDRETEKVTLANTDLVKRFRSFFRGKMSEEEIIEESYNVDLMTCCEILRMDLINDIDGERRPLSGLNYMMILVRCLDLFRFFEENLALCRNKTWVQTYEVNYSGLPRQNRLSLTASALKEADIQCLMIMAESFEAMEQEEDDFMRHVYWDKLLSKDEALKIYPYEESFRNICNVM